MHSFWSPHADVFGYPVDVLDPWPQAVCTIMIQATKLDLVCVQADITASFVHANLGPNKHIYVCQTDGLQKEGDLVLKLPKPVHGLKQSSRNFFKYLSDHLITQGFTLSVLNRCLFFGQSVIAMVYIGAVPFYSWSASCSSFLTILPPDCGH